MSSPALSLAGCQVLDDRLQHLCTTPLTLAAGHTLPADWSADGLWLLPGAVDLSCRLGEPGGPPPASLGSELRAARRNGFDTVLMNPDSQPCVDNAAVIEWIEHRAAAANGADLRLLGALTHQLDGVTLSSMDGLRRSGVAGLSQGDAGLPDSAALRHALLYAADVGLRVHLQPHEPGLHTGIVAAGPWASAQGLPDIPVAAETTALGRILALVEDTGCPVHIGRITSAAGADWVRWGKQRGLPITADVSLLHLLLDEQSTASFFPFARLQAPLRSAADRQALCAAVADGSIDAICSDHRPRPADLYQQPLAQIPPGAVGFDGFLPLLLQHPALEAIPLSRRLDAISQRPARIIGLAPDTPLGVVFAPYADGGTLAPEFMHSASSNTPLSGVTLTGRVCGVVVREELQLFTTAETKV